MRLLFTLCLLLTHAVLCQTQRNGRKPTKRLTVYSLTGRLTNAAGQKIYLVEHAFYKVKNRTDSTMADRNGEFRFTGQLSEATPYVLRTSLSRNELLLYLDNATMLVAGDARQIHLAKVTGSLEETIRQRYDSLWNAPAMWRLSTKIDTLDKAVEQAKIQTDSILVKRLLSQRDAVVDQQLALVLSQIKRYPRAAASVNSVVSFIDNNRLATADSLLKFYETTGIQQGQVDMPPIEAGVRVISVPHLVPVRGQRLIRNEIASIPGSRSFPGTTQVPAAPVSNTCRQVVR